MPLSEAATDLARNVVSPEPIETIDGRQKLRDAGFSDEVISGLGDELIQRFEAVLPIYSRGVEGNLALREALSLQHIEANEATEDQVSTGVEHFINTHSTGIVTQTQQAIEERVERYTQEAETLLTSQVNEQLAKKPFLALIANLFGINANSLIQGGKDRITNKLEGFSITAIVLGFFGINTSIFQAHADTLENISNGIFGDNTEQTLEEEDDTVGNNRVVPPSLEASPEVTSELREKTSVAGYVILSEMSGLDYGENSSEVGILSQISHFSLGELRGSLSSNRTFTEQFGLEDKGYSEEQIAAVVLGMIGPVNEEFFDSRLQKNILKGLLANDNDSYTSVALKYFSGDELDDIKGANYDYALIKLPLLGRLSAISVYSLVSTFAGNAQDYLGQGGENIRGFLLSDETLKLLNDTFTNDEIISDIYPQSLSAIFDALLNGKENLALDINQLANQADPALTEGSVDYIKLQQLIAFRDKVQNDIPENYSHDTLGFRNDFLENLTWGKIIFLYVSLDGKDITEVSGYEKGILYSWIYTTLSPDLQLNYFIKVADSLREEGGNDSKILTVLLLRFVGSSRDADVNIIRRSIGAINGVVETSLGLNEIKDPLYRWIAVKAVESGGITLLIKIFSKMPIMRAVILATSGVVVASIVLGVKQGLHNNLEGDIRKYYLDYLDAIAHATDYGNKEALISAIEGDNFSTTDFTQKILAIDLGSIATNVFGEASIT